MLSTKKHGTNILTIKEILENVFVAVPSSHTHSSPACTYYMDSSSASKPDTWELPMDLGNITKGSSLCVVKQLESLSSCGKCDLHSLTQGISDLSLTCFCKHPPREAAFDLSTFSNPLGSLLSKSTELSSDLSTPGKLPAPAWEISAIKAPLDISLSLDASTEDLRLLGCSSLDTPSLETSLVIPLSWPGAFRRPPALTCTSDTPDPQLKHLDPVPVFLHQAP
ncbi:uncharacterized protein LOC133226478 [Neopsephotus bourkii]|uniref:uncharacterized protein LOC133226478 n=1 Tax=Neopsephotus bourkii TaxID=309878 RepID=UPI002AA513E9|nr:uncharacterized protein LOC133226478 [Neopsephotus bourkii]